ncbi:MAG: C1 family peptidase [Candidatus Krumholzibacteriales bacterium]
MNRNLFTLAAALAISSIILSGPVLAGEKEITPGLIEELRKSIEEDRSIQALVNAVSNNDLKDLVFNNQFHREHNDLFNFKIETSGITDQKQSGRCWLFAGFNVMRPEVMDKFNLEQFEFSENYLFFWDKLEKANMFLEAMIETAGRDIDAREIQTLLENPVPDGGWWNYVVSLIEKYGTVPKEVMPETRNSSSTGRMNSQINGMARSFAATLRREHAAGANREQLREKKKEMLRKVYRLLILHLGMPPREFTWRVENRDKELFEKDYTPLSFYEEAVDTDLREYVNVMDHPSHEYNRLYRIRYCRNMPEVNDMEFVNLPVYRLREFARSALLNNEPVWFAADVGKGNDTRNGILSSSIYDYEALIGSSPEMSKSERVQYGESTPGHAMVLIGMDMGEDDRVVKWLVENSWGGDTGNNGLWTMYDEWFRKYVFSVIVHKRHLPGEVSGILETEPEILPPWDPMRRAFR